MFNDPDSPFSLDLLSRLMKEREERGGKADIPGIGGGAMIRGGGCQAWKGEGGRRDAPGINFAEGNSLMMREASGEKSYYVSCVLHDDPLPP